MPCSVRTLTTKAGVVICFVIMLLLAGCLQKGSLPGTGNMAVPKSEETTGRGEFNLLKVEFLEWRLHGGGATLIDSPYQPAGNEFTLLRDGFGLRLYFDRYFSEQDFVDCLTVTPELPYTVSQFIGMDDRWMIYIAFKEKVATGKKIIFRVAGLKSDDGIPLSEDIELIVTKAEEPLVTLECVTYPEKVPEGDPYFTTGHFLPLGKVEFRAEFSRPMDRESVIKALLNRIGPDIKLEAAWENDRVLNFTLESYQDFAGCTVDFSGSRDTDQNSIELPKVFEFRFMKARRYYSYNISTGKETFLAEEGLNLGPAYLSPGKKSVIFREPVYHFNGYSFYSHILFLDGRESRKLSPNLDNLHTTPSFWSPDGRYFALHQALYDDNGRKLADFKGNIFGAAFSPDSTRVAILTTDEEPYKLSLKIYDTETRTLISGYRHLVYWKGEGGFCNPTFTCWLSDDRIILDDGGFDYSDRRIFELNLETGEKTIFIEDAQDPVLSPCRQKLLFSLPDGTYLYELDSDRTTKVSDLLPPGRVRWSDDGKLFAFSSESISLYDTEKKALRRLPVEAEVAGWLDGETLLISR